MCSGCAGVSISTQPRDVIVVYGQEARLEVKAEMMTHSTRYQWFKNGQLLVGRTESQLVIASAVDSDEGSYTCQISTYEGSVMSHPASIKVVSVAPRLSHQSQQQKARENCTTSNSHHHPHELLRPSSLYGLKGRGVDDDPYTNDHNSQPSKPTLMPPTHSHSELWVVGT